MGLCPSPGGGLSCSPSPQTHEYVENQHVASNLTVRVSHDLLRAGAMCRVSNALGVSEKHIQLLGEPPTSLLFAPPPPLGSDRPAFWEPAPLRRGWREGAGAGWALSSPCLAQMGRPRRAKG